MRMPHALSCGFLPASPVHNALVNRLLRSVGDPSQERATGARFGKKCVRLVQISANAASRTESSLMGSFRPWHAGDALSPPAPLFTGRRALYLGNLLADAITHSLDTVAQRRRALKLQGCRRVEHFGL